jgi:hypothetical protein
VIPAACRPPSAAAVAPPLPPPPVEQLIELDDVTAAAAAARLVSRQQVEEDVVFVHRPPTNPRQPIDPLKSVLSSATTHRKVELEATRNYLFLISPFFLLPLPFIAYMFVYHFACPYMKLLAVNFPHQQQQQQQQPQDEASMMICHDFTWLVPYFIPVLMSMFTLINPIMNLLINTDFRSTSALDYLPPHLVALDY